jgi:hypothetical protein
MLGGELDDSDIIERLSRIFKDMPPYTACPVEEYSAARPPKEVSSRTLLVKYSLLGVDLLMSSCLAG